MALNVELPGLSAESRDVEKNSLAGRRGPGRTGCLFACRRLCLVLRCVTEADCALFLFQNVLSVRRLAVRFGRGVVFLVLSRYSIDPRWPCKKQ